MSVQRLAYAPLALLLALSTPSYAQTLAPGSPGHPPQRQGTQTQGSQKPQGRVKRQPGQNQSQPSRAQPPRAQSPSTVRSQPRQSQPPQTRQTQRREADQSQRRNSSTIQTYPGQQSYRTGSRPPLVQRRYDASRDRDRYRHTYRAEKRYRIRPYVRPRGWYLHDWVLGQILPSLFWTRSYWIVDYWLYGLPIPPNGCMWVRYDRDALLIDRHTGEIIEVIYDIFY